MLGLDEAIKDCGLTFFEVNGQKVFPVICTEGGFLQSQNVSYLRKQVAGQEGPVCAVVFSINETYESAMQKLADAAKILEAA